MLKFPFTKILHYTVTGYSVSVSICTYILIAVTYIHMSKQATHISKYLANTTGTTTHVSKY